MDLNGPRESSNFTYDVDDDNKCQSAQPLHFDIHILLEFWITACVQCGIGNFITPGGGPEPAHSTGEIWTRRSDLWFTNGSLLRSPIN